MRVTPKQTTCDYGLDAKWAPIRAVSVDLTVNTDFGETEADDLQTNLTRFSLFQAEKREFFLENSGIFEFGPGALGSGALSVMSVGALSFGSSGSSGSAPLLKLFHSRQVGIDVQRREGPDRLGRPHDRAPRALEHGCSWTCRRISARVPRVGTRFPRTNFGAFRVSRNLAGRSSVGMIYTDRNGGGDGNRSYGLDLHLRPNKSLAIDSYAARTETAGTKNTNDWSAGLITTWNGPVWHAQGGWVHIGEAFEPQMGFLLRRGIDRYNARVTAEPFVRKAGILNLHFEIDTAVYTALDGKVETEEYRLDLGGLRTSAGHEAKLFVTQTYDSPSEPFPIGRGFSIPVGSYRFNATGASFLTHASRPDLRRGAGPLRRVLRWRSDERQRHAAPPPQSFSALGNDGGDQRCDACGRQLRVEGVPAAPRDGVDAAGARERVRAVQRPVPGRLGQLPV